MIESPVLQELKAEWTREAAVDAALKTNRRAIVDFLSARFGVTAQTLATQLEPIADDAMLERLIKLAAVCPDLQSFQKELAALPGDMH